MRRRMLEFLTLHGPSTVGAITAGLGQQVGSVSHHVKTLGRAGFVKASVRPSVEASV
ncbi:MAG: winged helix-turn-helix domain-containing protein [Nocardioidaceae bacterium]